MTALRQVLVVIAVVILTAGSVSPAAARSVGQVIDDTVITTEAKAKLSAEKLSNLTKIEVKTQNGIVTLNGTVDDPVRRARAEQIVSTVGGVKAIVNNIHVAGSTIPAQTVASAPVPAAAVDVTGIGAAVDAANGTITLQDGRALRVTGQSAIWQPSSIQGLRPGAQVFVRDAMPVAVQPTASVGPPEWRMGTVRSVDRTAGVLVLTDGTLVRVTPTALVRRGSERVGIDQIAPGSEVVIRALPPAFGGAAEGSALPGRMATAATIDASEVSVVWAPVRR
jgi:hypothetical protein